MPRSTPTPTGRVGPGLDEVDGVPEQSRRRSPRLPVTPSDQPPTTGAARRARRAASTGIANTVVPLCADRQRQREGGEREVRARDSPVAKYAQTTRDAATTRSLSAVGVCSTTTVKVEKATAPNAAALRRSPAAVRSPRSRDTARRARGAGRVRRSDRRRSGSSTRRPRSPRPAGRRRSGCRAHRDVRHRVLLLPQRGAGRW